MECFMDFRSYATNEVDGLSSIPTQNNNNGYCRSMLDDNVTDNIIYGKDNYSDNYYGDDYCQSMGMTELNDLIHDDLEALIENMLTDGESCNTQ